MYAGQFSKYRLFPPPPAGDEPPAAVPGDEPDAPDDASSLPPPHADSSAGSEIPAAPSAPARDQELASRERRSATEWEGDSLVAAGHGKPFTWIVVWVVVESGVGLCFEGVDVGRRCAGSHRPS